MTLEAWFWIVMALWFFFGAWERVSESQPPRWASKVGGLLPFVAVLLLGLRTFGAIVK